MNNEIVLSIYREEETCSKERRRKYRSVRDAMEYLRSIEWINIRFRVCSSKYMLQVYGYANKCEAKSLRFSSNLRR